MDIRVDLPSYSRSFLVHVQPSSSIIDVKREIYRICPGQPRPDGQRLIWRGRVLGDDENIDNLWKAEPRIVHLAVHPSAWSSAPPAIPQPEPQSPTLTPSPMPSRSSPYTFSTPPTPALRNPLAFVEYKHQTALSFLSPSISPPDELQFPQASRSAAISALGKMGWLWPDIFDEQFPTAAAGGAVYEVVVIDGQSYLQLSDSSKAVQPTAAQAHALKVLSYTFNILSMPLPPAPPVRAVPSHSMPIPPHVNQLLQQLGLPPLRVAGNNPNPVANPNIPEIREIAIRPLLAPIMMLVFRTLVLLYFVAPARKPIFGILILMWMLYEIWQPIRNGLRNRIPDNQQRPNNAADLRQANGQANAPHAPAARPAANMPVRPGPVGPATINLQAGAVFDALANMNIEEEERMLNQVPGTSTTEPSLAHKMGTFIGLLATTLHPAIWNRRRIALRRREGIVRTEASIRNAPPPPTEGDAEPTSGEIEAVRRREELRAHFNRRPRWIQRYMERVVAEDWVDDAE